MAQVTKSETKVSSFALKLERGERLHDVMIVGRRLLPLDARTQTQESIELENGLGLIFQPGTRWAAMRMAMIDLGSWRVDFAATIEFLYEEPGERVEHGNGE